MSIETPERQAGTADAMTEAEVINHVRQARSDLEAFVTRVEGAITRHLEADAARRTARKDAA